MAYIKWYVNVSYSGVKNELIFNKLFLGRKGRFEKKKKLFLQFMKQSNLSPGYPCLVIIPPQLTEDMLEIPP